MFALGMFLIAVALGAVLKIDGYSWEQAALGVAWLLSIPIGIVVGLTFTAPAAAEFAEAKIVDPNGAVQAARRRELGEFEDKMRDGEKRLAAVVVAQLGGVQKQLNARLSKEMEGLKTAKVALPDDVNAKLDRLLSLRDELEPLLAAVDVEVEENGAKKKVRVNALQLQVLNLVEAFEEAQKAFYIEMPVKDEKTGTTEKRLVPAIPNLEVILDAWYARTRTSEEASFMAKAGAAGREQKMEELAEEAATKLKWYQEHKDEAAEGVELKKDIEMLSEYAEKIGIPKKLLENERFQKRVLAKLHTGGGPGQPSGGGGRAAGGSYSTAGF